MAVLLNHRAFRSVGGGLTRTFFLSFGQPHRVGHRLPHLLFESPGRRQAANYPATVGALDQLPCGKPCTRCNQYLKVS
jgi:hypothetical protein